MYAYYIRLKLVCLLEVYLFPSNETTLELIVLTHQNDIFMFRLSSRDHYYALFPAYNKLCWELQRIHKYIENSFQQLQLRRFRHKQMISFMFNLCVEIDFKMSDFKLSSLVVWFQVIIQ